jgi:hypothetical protein
MSQQQESITLNLALRVVLSLRHKDRTLFELILALSPRVTERQVEQDLVK